MIIQYNIPRIKDINAALSCFTTDVRGKSHKMLHTVNATPVNYVNILASLKMVVPMCTLSFYRIKKTHKISNKTHYTQSDRYPIRRHSRFCCATKHGFRSNARNQLEGDSKLDHMLETTEDPVSPWGLMILSALKGLYRLMRELEKNWHHTKRQVISWFEDTQIIQFFFFFSGNRL